MAERLSRVRPGRTPWRGSFRGLCAVLALPVAIAAPAVAHGRAEPASAVRRTHSVASSFEAFWSAARGRPFEEQLALWDRLVEEPRATLYASVVWEKTTHLKWAEQKTRLLRARFEDYRQLSDALPKAARALESDLPTRNARFRGLFPDAPARPPVQVVLAPNFDAKSGVLDDGSPVLVFAVDSLLLEHADLDVVFPHELFHLYQARRAGIENDGVMPGADLTLPLFAEGLATYVSGLLAPGRSEGQLLLQDDLGALPSARLPEIARRFLADADAKAVDPAHPEPFQRWFNAGRTAFQTDLPNRSGYWLGLQVARELRRKHKLEDLASWSPARAQRETRAILTDLARRAPSSGVRP